MKSAFGTGLTTRRRALHGQPGQRHSILIADSAPTIATVTQAPHPRCLRSLGTLSAISLDWVSAIGGMRTIRVLQRSSWHEVPRPEDRKEFSQCSEVRAP
jgi:hypothetical protein